MEITIIKKGVYKNFLSNENMDTFEFHETQNTGSLWNEDAKNIDVRFHRESRKIIKNFKYENKMYNIVIEDKLLYSLYGELLDLLNDYNIQTHLLREENIELKNKLKNTNKFMRLFSELFKRR